MSLILLLTLIGFVLCAERNENSLQLLHIITRHGERTPLYLYPNDPNREEFEEKLGQLTNLGKLQQYTLGKYFRKRYADFITSNPREVEARSSNKDRTITSGLCHLAGLYAPTKEWEFSDDLQWQPIKILTSPSNTDRLLDAVVECPEASAELNRIQNSPEGEAHRKKYTELFNDICERSGIIIDNWWIGAFMSDTIKFEKSYNMNMPDWLTEEIYKKLEKSFDDFFSLAYKSVKLQRLRIGVLLGEIVKHIQEKDRGELNNFNKVYAYFTHDINIAVFLNALKIFNGRAPPFCATILVEFHKFEDSSCAKVFYSNSTNPENGEQSVHLMTLPDCGLECCPLDTFVDIVHPLIPTDWDKECELKTAYNSDSFQPWWEFNFGKNSVF